MSYTIKQLLEKNNPQYLSDKLLLTHLVSDRINKLTQVYSPLSKRLTDLRNKIDTGVIKFPKNN